MSSGAFPARAPRNRVVLMAKRASGSGEVGGASGIASASSSSFAGKGGAASVSAPRPTSNVEKGLASEKARANSTSSISSVEKSEDYEVTFENSFEGISNATLDSNPRRASQPQGSGDTPASVARASSFKLPANNASTTADLLERETLEMEERLAKLKTAMQAEKERLQSIP